MKITKSLLKEHSYLNNKNFIGSIKLEDGLVDITDPCYDRKTWCRTSNTKILPGVYSCYVSIKNFPYTTPTTNKNEYLIHDNFRIKSLSIVHSDFSDDYINDMTCEQEFTEVGVDAGLFGFYNHKPDYSDTEWQKFCDYLYSTNDGCLIMDCQDSGVTVSSGFGDGSYSVYKLLNDDNNVVGFKIYFIEDE